MNTLILISFCMIASLLAVSVQLLPGELDDSDSFEDNDKYNYALHQPMQELKAQYKSVKDQTKFEYRTGAITEQQYREQKRANEQNYKQAKQNLLTSAAAAAPVYSNQAPKLNA